MPVVLDIVGGFWASVVNEAQAVQGHVAVAVLIQLEDCSAVIGAAKDGRAIERAVTSFQQARLRIISIPVAPRETVQNGETASVPAQLEDRPCTIAAATRRSPIQRPVTSLYNGHRIGTLVAVDEQVQHRVAAAVHVQPEYRSDAVCAARNSTRTCRAVERCVPPLHHAQRRMSNRVSAAVETAQHCMSAPILVQLEDRPAAAESCSAPFRRPVERTVAPFHQGHRSTPIAISPGEMMQHHVTAAVRVQFECGACVVGPSPKRRPIKLPVTSIDERRSRIGA